MADLSALVAELRALEEKATPGPWSVEYDSCDCGGGYPCDHGEWPYRIRGAKEARPGSIDLGGPTEIGEFVADDAECMVAARNALPALLDALETAQRERDARALMDPREREPEMARTIQEQAAEIARLEERIATLEAALATAVRELETWRNTVDEEQWGGVAIRLTSEAIGEGRAALRAGKETT